MPGFEKEFDLDLNTMDDKEYREMLPTFVALVRRMESDYQESKRKYPDGYFAKKLREYLRFLNVPFMKIKSKRVKQKTEEETRWRFE